MIGWVSLILGITVAGWLVAAFVLRWRQDARCALTVLTPTAIVAALILRFFLAGDTGPDIAERAAWRGVFVVVSVLAGSVAVFPALPLWLLLEARLGARAP